MRVAFCGTTNVTLLAVALFSAAAGNPTAAPAESALRLNLSLSNAAPIVTWSDPAAALQSAPSVAGNWTTLSNAVSSQWHHLAGVWTGTQLQIYEDAVLQDTLSQTNVPANNGRDVEIGRSWGGGTPARFFRGLIDEVTYFSRALSSNDVNAIFNAGAAGKCKP